MKFSKRFLVVLCCIALACAAFAFTDPEALGEVVIKNWPKVFNVDGTVAVKGTIPHGLMIRRESVVVPTSHRYELTELVSAGSVDADGFTTATLSLAGECKSNTPGDGIVGVMLVPEEEPVFRALRDARRVEFPIEAATPITKGGSFYFDSGSVTQPLAFPRYRVYLYNTSAQAVEANVYIYLKN